MSFTPGDASLADGTMAKAIFDALVAEFGADPNVDDARVQAAVALAVGICEHANPNLPSSGMVGPATSTDGGVPRFDGTTGQVLQSSPVTIDDSGNITGVGTVDGRDVSVDGATLDTHETRIDGVESDVASLDASLGSHLLDTGNPHAVTAAQTGAAPSSHVGAGGAAHAGAIANGDAGFMSGADKSKLDGLRNPARALFTKVGLVKSGTGSATTTILDSAAWTEQLDTHDYWTQVSDGRFTYGGPSSTFVVRCVGTVLKTVAADAIRLLLFLGGADVATDSSSAVVNCAAGENTAVCFTTVVTLAPGDILDVRARSGSSANEIRANVTLELEEVVS